MTVKNVQDVMSAAVAVGGRKGADAPEQRAPETAQQEIGAAKNGNVPAAAGPQTADENAESERLQHEPLSEEQTAFITDQLNEIMRSINVDLQFQYHKEVNVMSVRMLDKKTGEVLREIPPESMVEHMIKVHDWIGAFLDKTA